MTVQPIKSPRSAMASEKEMERKGKSNIRHWWIHIDYTQFIKGGSWREVVNQKRYCMIPCTCQGRTSCIRFSSLSDQLSWTTASHMRPLFWITKVLPLKSGRNLSLKTATSFTAGRLKFSNVYALIERRVRWSNWRAACGRLVMIEEKILWYVYSKTRLQGIPLARKHLALTEVFQVQAMQWLLVLAQFWLKWDWKRYN